MDPFETDEEYSNRKRRNAVIMVSIITLIVVVGTGAYLYEMFRPLPQRPECAAIGWDAGTIENGVVTCYDDCVENNIRLCKKIWVKR